MAIMKMHEVFRYSSKMSVHSLNINLSAEYDYNTENDYSAFFNISIKCVKLLCVVL